MLVMVKSRGTSEDGALERLRRIEREVEEQVRGAVDRGDLAGLPGEGRPLPPDEDEAAGDRWAAAHVMRNADVVPEWVDLRREVQEARARLVRRVRSHREWLAARTRALRTLSAERILDAVRATDEADRLFRRELATTVVELNGRIALYNLMVRAHVLQLTSLTVERLSELATAREE